MYPQKPVDVIGHDHPSERIRRAELQFLRRQMRQPGVEKQRGTAMQNRGDDIESA